MGHVFRFSTTFWIQLKFLTKNSFFSREKLVPGLQNISQLPVSVLVNGAGVYRDPQTNSIRPVPLAVFRMNPHRCRSNRFRVINSDSSVCPMQLQVGRFCETVNIKEVECPVWETTSLNTFIRHRWGCDLIKKTVEILDWTTSPESNCDWFIFNQTSCCGFSLLGSWRTLWLLYSIKSAWPWDGILAGYNSKRYMFSTEYRNVRCAELRRWIYFW